MRRLLLTLIDRVDQWGRDKLCSQGHMCLERDPATGFEEWWCRACRRPIDGGPT